MGVSFDAIEALEPDAALGNGGLGRLAACYMESMATVGIPAYGYGIRYVHGLFHQEIRDGKQIELPEDWLSHGNLWEFERREAAYEIGFGGSVESTGMPDGSMLQRWHPQEKIFAIAYDTPIVGWRGARVNTLRLWSARAANPISLDEFNRGDHIGALADLTRAETITRVLYPAEFDGGRSGASPSPGVLLRLGVAPGPHPPPHQAVRLDRDPRRQGGHPAQRHASVDRHRRADANPARSASHPLGQRRGRSRASAISYTNHTLLPEALESWPVGLMERLLPRHMQIIYEINAHLLEEARDKLDANAALLASLSLIDEEHGRRVRMGQLAFVGSHKVNGVSALHTELMKETVFSDLHVLYPDRINEQDQRDHGAALAACSRTPP